MELITIMSNSHSFAPLLKFEGLHSSELGSLRPPRIVQVLLKPVSRKSDGVLQLSVVVSGQLFAGISFRSWRDTQLSQLRLVGISPPISQVSASSQYLSIVS